MTDIARKASLGRRFVQLLAAVLLLGSCGGGDDTGSHELSGTVVGLTQGALVIAARADSAPISVDANRGLDVPFAFAPLSDGTRYTVQILAQPAELDCRAQGETGTGAVQAEARVVIVCHRARALRLLAGYDGVPGAADEVGVLAGFGTAQITLDVIGGMAFDKVGNLYIADTEVHTIRRITPGRSVSTIAGQPGLQGSEDGVGPAARFNYPLGLAVDGDGNVFVADSRNHTIRKVTQDGTVTTVAGLAGVAGNKDGIGTEARLNEPTAVAVVDGALLVVDSANHAVRRIDAATGFVHHLAGTSGVAGADDGPAGTSRLRFPQGLAVGQDGIVYIADRGNHTIRTVTSDGSLGTLAGLAGVEGIGDGEGSQARFRWPYAISRDGAGNLYVTDPDGPTLRKIDTAGFVSTLAGHALVGGVQGENIEGTGTAVRFSAPRANAVDAAGNVYVGDFYKVWKVSPTGRTTTFAGWRSYNAPDDGFAEDARFHRPVEMAINSSGQIYVADSDSGAIRKVTPDGEVTTIIGTSAGLRRPAGITFDAVGDLYIADAGSCLVRKLTPAGVLTTVVGGAGTSSVDDCAGAQALGNFPLDVAIGPSGTLYVADYGVIRKIAPDGNVTTLAGQVGEFGYADGTGSAARFGVPPLRIAAGAGGDVFVADSHNRVIRRISAIGEVSTIAGLAGAGGDADGIAANARFSFPVGITEDAEGRLIVADAGRYLGSEPYLPGIRQLSLEAGQYKVATLLKGNEQVFSSPSAPPVAVAVAGARIYIAAGDSIHFHDR